MCIFKQFIDLAKLLPVKSHQLYKDIILLKQYLLDLFPQQIHYTNIEHSHLQLIDISDQNQITLENHIDSFINSFLSNNSFNVNEQLIDLLIAIPTLISQLKALVQSIVNYDDLQFYMDSSLQRILDQVDVMGLSWIFSNNEEIIFSASAIL